MSPNGVAKYTHHIPKVSPTPATTTATAVPVQCVPSAPPSSPPDDATVPTTPSPSVMIANRLYRSATWCGCQGVLPAPPWPSTGSISSSAASTAKTAKTAARGRCVNAITVQAAWTVTVQRIMAMPMSWKGGESRAARHHWSTIATRITTYPTTIARSSRRPPSSTEWNIAGRPSANTTTPIICTMVSAR